VQRKTRYVRWMKWHYWTGVAFGIFAFTWTFSGLLSIEPADWASTRADTARSVQVRDVLEALSGGPLDLAKYPSFTPPALRNPTVGRVAKEIAFRRIQGDPYYEVRDGSNEVTLATVPSHGKESPQASVTVSEVVIRSQPFNAGEIVRRLERAVSQAPVVSSV